MTVFFVEGNIGTGKSTFLSLIQKYYPQHQVIYEPVDIWTSLADKDGVNILQYFYDDPKRYAYAFQSLAFISRMEKLKEIDPTRHVFIERSIWSDSNVFARNCFMQGTLSDIEYKLYQRWFVWTESSIKAESTNFKYVYLRCDPKTSFERTLIRKRKEESNIPLEYIEQIHDRHEEWLSDKQDTTTIDFSSEEYVNNERAFRKLFDTLIPVV